MEINPTECNPSMMMVNEFDLTDKVDLDQFTRGQAEKEFKVEVEAIGKVRHKNLVGLLGYCAEAAKRLLVYEYVDNGTLEQWLRGDVGTFSPLTWDIRMKIALDRSSTLLNVVCCQCIFRRSQIRI
ncbi:hypothetical protein J5N97_005291 [Dioscorea zingiberensis]|uniref:Serine-threonine/tyrosine-protein kinase catalytic domain-containing protein n=1 Tax=Dioscorea zingiberensis TaxID=325984 RepID=A0A9D5DA73_9LILI|nr:hypothetical protein J5N97_005291 [Dioscorea zingiberensis]